MVQRSAALRSPRLNRGVPRLEEYRTAAAMLAASGGDGKTFSRKGGADGRALPEAPWQHDGGPDEELRPAISSSPYLADVVGGDEPTVGPRDEQRALQATWSITAATSSARPRIAVAVHASRLLGHPGGPGCRTAGDVGTSGRWPPICGSSRGTSALRPAVVRQGARGRPGRPTPPDLRRSFPAPRTSASRSARRAEAARRINASRSRRRLRARRVGIGASTQPRRTVVAAYTQRGQARAAHRDGPRATRGTSRVARGGRGAAPPGHAQLGVDVGDVTLDGTDARMTPPAVASLVRPLVTSSITSSSRGLRSSIRARRPRRRAEERRSSAANTARRARRRAGCGSRCPGHEPGARNERARRPSSTGTTLSRRECATSVGRSARRDSATSMPPLAS